MRKVLAILTVFFCVAALGFSGGQQEMGDADGVKITVLNSKGEIQEPMEKAADIFEAENPGIEVEVLLCPVGTSPFERISVLYAAGNGPSIAIVDGGNLPDLNDKAADLSAEKWVGDTPFAADCSIDGKVIAFPVTVEGCGFIYNEEVLAKAGVNPAAITTRDALADAFKKVEAIGVAPVVVGPMDWSLGNHILPITFAGQSSGLGEVSAYLDGLKDGSTNIANDAVFNGLLDTIDLLKGYNYAKADPLGAVDYDACAQLIATGEVAFYFQGNWVWPGMEGYGNTGFGYIPVPVSNDADDPANAGIQAGVTKYAIVDTTQNTEAQQAAAKQFLNWLVYSESGQKALVQDAKIIMAFNNVALEPVDPLSKSIVSYMKNGQTLPFAGNVVPGDHWSILGASMQQYLVDVIDRPTLASDIMAYWAEK